MTKPLGNKKSDTSFGNKILIVQAPSLNHVAGKMLEIMDNPYSSDKERVADMYEILEEIRNAYVSDAD